MGLTLATNVKSETSTSSPRPTPSRRSPRWIAAVPLASATAGRSSRSVKAFSKASSWGPTLESQFEAKASRT